jgi:hypothetical protein
VLVWNLTSTSRVVLLFDALAPGSAFLSLFKGAMGCGEVFLSRLSCADDDVFLGDFLELVLSSRPNARSFFRGGVVWTLTGRKPYLFFAGEVLLERLEDLGVVGARAKERGFDGELGPQCSSASSSWSMSCHTPVLPESSWRYD